MMKIETGEQLAQACRAAAQQKTLYVYGAFGWPLTQENRTRILAGYAYNRKAAREKKILAADAQTFGFDCSGLIKGLLWGWTGDAQARYGGASYRANGVPDCSADGMIAACEGVSEDFSDILVGEAVWMKGHIGVYVGDGLAVECTPKWADGVQLTACNRTLDGYPTRTWVKHGRLPYLRYESGVCVTLPILRQGAQGEPVRALQRLLYAMGYPIGTKDPMDGKFGEKTDAALRAFQKSRKLPDSGATDRATWEALLEVSGWKAS